jgi:hypothetical protein
VVDAEGVWLVCKSAASVVTVAVEERSEPLSVVTTIDVVATLEVEPVGPVPDIRIKLSLAVVTVGIALAGVKVLTIWVGLSALTRYVQADCGPGVSTTVSVWMENTISDSGMVFVVHGPTLVV